jgi:hypothetical protein
MSQSALAGAREVLSVAGYGDDVIDADYAVWLGPALGVGCCAAACRIGAVARCSSASSTRPSARPLDGFNAVLRKRRSQLPRK